MLLNSALTGQLYLKPSGLSRRNLPSLVWHPVCVNFAIDWRPCGILSFPTKHEPWSPRRAEPQALGLTIHWIILWDQGILWLEYNIAATPWGKWSTFSIILSFYPPASISFWKSSQTLPCIVFIDDTTGEARYLSGWGGATFTQAKYGS